MDNNQNETISFNVNSNEKSIEDLYTQLSWHSSGVLTDYELLCFCKSLNPIKPEVGYVDPATGLKYPFNVKR